VSNGDHSWVYKVLRIITKDEVKTPLSFLFRVAAWIVAAVIAVSYAPISDTIKLTVLAWVLYALLALAAGVLLFAWFRPKHLVYGETGHRAEHKVEYGTEKNIATRDEVELLPQGTNPELPAIEDRR
jgi:hypothetical protein